MSPIVELPPELKLEIICHLDSIADLTSVSHTCRSFHDMTKEEYWNTVEKTVFRNETATLPPEWNSLSDLRYFKAGKTYRELLGINPFLIDIDLKQDLDGLVDLRKTVRWFTRRFFQQQLKDKPGEAAPSYTEIARVDGAFCVLWLWMECFYEPTKRLDVMRGLIGWALGEGYSEYQMTHGTHLGTLLACYFFLMSQLEHLGRLLALRKSRDDLEQLSGLCPCLDQYFSIGIPNMLLISEGLDGVKALLEHSLHDQLVGAAPYFDHLVETADDIYSPIFDWENTASYFITEINNFWSPSLSSPELSSRPLWNLPPHMRIYRHYAPPWQQPKGFQHMATFWDDERLSRWGWRPSFDIDFIPPPPTSHESLESVVLDRNHCTGCLPSWGCEFQKRPLS
ncbi:hypothetical protein TWF281_011366 [Arthrobotrys megalospora]